MCGVIGIAAPGGDAARLGFFGLHSLQHRGQEAAGLAVADGRAVRVHKGQGLVGQVFSANALDPLAGGYAVGHTRYSTTGASSDRNTQPYVVETLHGPLAVAFNGNLVNVDELRTELLSRGAGLSSTSDTEVMALMLTAAPGDDWEERLAHVMRRWVGAYSLVVLTGDRVLVARDPWGFRPLSYGRLPAGGHVAASETGALATLGCTDVKEVAPGHVVSLMANLARDRAAVPPAPSARCTFEHIYFSRPDSVWDNVQVHEVRQRLGEVLAHEHPADADVVVPVPDSSLPAAIGYARASGLPMTEGFVKNRYIGRTFIEPTDALRRQGVKLKYTMLPCNLERRRVVVIDDSIVRGTTAGPLIRMVRDAGASEVHLRVTCPPIAHPCFMGVDMATHDELIAAQLSVSEIGDHVGADSLGYLSVEGMMKALGRDDGYCNACFTGSYPIEIGRRRDKERFEGALW
jgi:amidophosphoribosyltransferase